MNDPWYMRIFNAIEDATAPLVVAAVFGFVLGFFVGAAVVAAVYLTS